MPTARQILTVSREKLTLMAMVLFLLFTKSLLKLGWSLFATVFKNLFQPPFLQAEGLANVFSITITVSKPVRSKPGVLLKSMLQYGKADEKCI